MGGRVYDPIHDVFQDSNTSSAGNDVADTTESSDVQKQPTSSSIAIALNSDDDDDTDENDENDIVEQNNDNSGKKEEDFLSDKNISLGKEYGPMLSALRYNRHLKKTDGDYFSRKDLQFTFLETLLNDKRVLFTNVFKDFYLNSLVPSSPVPSSTNSDNNGDSNSKFTPNEKVVNVSDEDYDARKFMTHDKLTFSQLYILCLGTSTKSSKILRDKLLSDPQVAFSTCLLGFLLNIGRLNTTINFYIAMTSQLRTFHAIPALQRGVSDPKSLQDTPRLKSILKGLPIGNDPISIMDLYQTGHTWKTGVPNIINLLFAICDNVTLVNSRFFNDKYLSWDNSRDGIDLISLFTITDQPRFNVEDRVNFLLWLLYIHLETNMTDSEIEDSLKQFGSPVSKDGKIHWRIRLNENDKGPEEEDIDTPDEIEFGLEQKEKRREFLEKTQKEKMKENKEKNDTEQNKIKIDMITSPSSKVSSVDTRIQTGSPVSIAPKSPTPQRQTTHSSRLANILNPVDNDEHIMKFPSKNKDPEQIKGPATNETDGTVVVTRKTTNGSPTTFKTRTFEVASIKKKRKRRTKAEMLDAKRLESENSLGQRQKNNKDGTPIASSAILHYNSESPAPHSPKESTGTPLIDFRQSTEYKSAATKINEERVSKMIQLDATKQLAGIDKTQKEFLDDLLEGHKIARQKRKEIGLIKIFNEYEDITMASVIGIRGKKRKKFQDELLGFETDCLRDFMAAKKVMLDKVVGKQEDNEVDKDFFKL